jgi:ribosomal protein L14
VVTHTRDYTPRDNTGVLLARGINLVGPDNGPARTRASLIRVAPGKKLTRGDLAEFLIFGVRRQRCRLTGTTVKLDYNGAMLIRPDGHPVGSKILSPLWLEARWEGSYSRAHVMSKFLL